MNFEVTKNLSKPMDPAASPEKRWEDLTLGDNFLFCKIMSDPELCAELLRRIFPGLSIGSVQTSEMEKTINPGIDSHAIRMDVFADDGKHLFDVEMQATHSKVLPKRARYYQGVMDVTELEKSLNYDELRDSYVIFICPYDLFRQGRHRYTFRNLCIESPEIELKDGTTKVFLNTVGTKNDIDPKLKAFLDLLTGNVTDQGDAFINKLLEEQKKAKRNRKWRKEYMMQSVFERDAFLRGEDQGIEKGRKEGLQYGAQAMADTLRELGHSEEQIARILHEKFDYVQEETEPFILPTKGAE